MLSVVREILSPNPHSVHFRVYDSRARPYNLCTDAAGELRSTPYRSVVTCPTCLERLR